MCKLLKNVTILFSLKGKLGHLSICQMQVYSLFRSAEKIGVLDFCDIYIFTIQTFSLWLKWKCLNEVKKRKAHIFFSGHYYSNSKFTARESKILSFVSQCFVSLFSSSTVNLTPPSTIGGLPCAGPYKFILKYIKTTTSWKLALPLHC